VTKSLSCSFNVSSVSGEVAVEEKKVKRKIFCKYVKAD